METSSDGGSASPDSVLGSDDASDEELCEQCLESGLSVVSYAYCTDCNDRLCRNCTLQHKTLRGLKEHKLLEGKDMPRQKLGHARRESCVDHPGEMIKLYCQSHNVLGCILCITESHRACQNVTAISRLSKDFQKCKELIDYKEQIEQQKITLKSFATLIHENLALNDVWYDQSIHDFEIFKRKIEDTLGCLQEQVYEDASKLRREYKEKLEFLTESLKSLEEQLILLCSDVELREKTLDMDQLFIAVKKNAKHIDEQEQLFDQLRAEVILHRYRYEAKSAVQDALDEMLSTGSMKMFSGVLKSAGQTNIKVPDEHNECLACGITDISPTVIVVADYFNYCLKKVDTDQNQTITKRSLPTPPSDVTSPSGSLVAATFPREKQIRFFTIDGLELQNSISVDGKCLVIESTAEALFVLFKDPAKVQMLDHKGNILKVILSDNHIFESPSYLSLSPDKGCIYISDFMKNNVTCLAIDGTVQWTYKDPDLQCPMGVATAGDGQLYICSSNNHCIHVLSPGQLRMKVIPLQPLNIHHPSAICYSREQDMLYVSSDGRQPEQCNFIRQLCLQ